MNDDRVADGFTIASSYSFTRLFFLLYLVSRETIATNGTCRANAFRTHVSTIIGGDETIHRTIAVSDIGFARVRTRILVARVRTRRHSLIQRLYVWVACTTPFVELQSSVTNFSYIVICCIPCVLLASVTLRRIDYLTYVGFCFRINKLNDMVTGVSSFSSISRERVTEDVEAATDIATNSSSGVVANNVPMGTYGYMYGRGLSEKDVVNEPAEQSQYARQRYRDDDEYAGENGCSLLSYCLFLLGILFGAVLSFLIILLIRLAKSY